MDENESRGDPREQIPNLATLLEGVKALPNPVDAVMQTMMHFDLQWDREPDFKSRVRDWAKQAYGVIAEKMSDKAAAVAVAMTGALDLQWFCGLLANGDKTKANLLKFILTSDDEDLATFVNYCESRKSGRDLMAFEALRSLAEKHGCPEVLKDSIQPQTTTSGDGAAAITKSFASAFSAPQMRKDTGMGLFDGLFGGNNNSSNDGDSVATSTVVAGAKGGSVRVKTPKDMYSSTKQDLTYSAKSFRAGQPIMVGTERLKGLSDLDVACIGAFLKHIVRRGGAPMEPASDHEKALLAHAAEAFEWNGFIGQGNSVQEFRSTDPVRTKALLSDTTSGGSYIVPTVFDDALILKPLLFGELFPEVEVVNLARGNSVDAATMGDVTLNWDQAAEGTALTPFSAADLLNQIQTAVHCCTFAVEVGSDWMADTPLAIGQILTERIGTTLLTELDKVVATGNGTTQPTGLFTASGTTDVPSASGTSGPYSVGDAETLAWALPKAYRNQRVERCAFIGNDATYRRFRSVPRGTDDAQRIFGMDHMSYTLLEWPFRINNSIPDGYCGFSALRRYRMYRRLGSQVRWTDQGQTLALKNTSLLVLRARYGGQPTIGEAVAIMNDGAIEG